MSETTPDDLLVNQAVMDQCNHPRFTRKVVPGKFSDRLKITCESCRISETFSSGAVEELSEIPPDYMMRTMTLVYSRDLWVARTVIRHLEGRGWRWSIASRNGALTLSLVKGDIRISSGSHEKESVAIVDAAARLARSHPGEI